MSIRKYLITILTFLIFSISFSSDDHSHEKNNETLGMAKTTWRLEYISGNTTSGKNITLDISGDRINGFSGVNTYSASYTVKMDDVSISRIGSTKKAGPKELMDFENFYLNHLQRVKKLISNTDELIFLTDKNEVLIFRAHKH